MSKLGARSRQGYAFKAAKLCFKAQSGLQGTAISCGGKHGGNRDAEVSCVELASDLHPRVNTDRRMQTDPCLAFGIGQFSYRLNRPVREVEQSGDCCFPVGHNFNLGAQLYIEGIQQPNRPLQRYAKILVPLISGYLGFMHIEFLGQVSLREALSNANRDQGRRADLVPDPP